MRVPRSLADAFGPEFEKTLAEFLAEHELLPTAADLSSPRFLARSVAPHVKKLSELFNRQSAETVEGFREGLDPYWAQSSNPKNLRLAYLLSFMPSNLFRVASVWAELQRLGYRWPHQGEFRGIEWGAGPASGACGIAAGEKHAPVGLPTGGSWALIDQNKPMLEAGEAWASRYFETQGFDWTPRPFHRKVDFSDATLPRSAPSFHLWLTSFFLNEATPEQTTGLARTWVKEWDLHLEQEGLVILVEPALRQQSRKLLELRAALIEEFAKSEARGRAKYQILLPCLGHQACGALADKEDWCHEEVTWWRPPYFKRLDEMTGLDRKSLAFSYLVIAKSARPMGEILPALAGAKRFERVISPPHKDARDVEFFFCGPDEKRRGRFRIEGQPFKLERGDVILDSESRGEKMHLRIEKLKPAVTEA